MGALGAKAQRLLVDGWMATRHHMQPLMIKMCVAMTTVVVPSFLSIQTLRHAPYEAGGSAADLDSAHTGSQSHSIGLDSVRFVVRGLPQTLHARVTISYQYQHYTYTIAPRCTGNDESAERAQTLQ